MSQRVAYIIYLKKIFFAYFFSERKQNFWLTTATAQRHTRLTNARTLGESTITTTALAGWLLGESSCGNGIANTNSRNGSNSSRSSNSSRADDDATSIYTIWQCVYICMCVAAFIAMLRRRVRERAADDANKATITTSKWVAGEKRAIKTINRRGDDEDNSDDDDDDDDDYNIYEHV